MSGQSVESFETVSPASKYNSVISCSAVDEFLALAAFVIGRGFLRSISLTPAQKGLAIVSGRARPPMSERMPSAITMIELHLRVLVFPKARAATRR
jgi:hypothetical protein